jgi:hypothetical protein
MGQADAGNGAQAFLFHHSVAGYYVMQIPNPVIPAHIMKHPQDAGFCWIQAASFGYRFGGAACVS